MKYIENFQRIQNDPTQFKLYVDTELNKVITWAGANPHEWEIFPANQIVEWEVNSHNELEWSVEMKEDRLISYNLTISPDLKMIIVTHGNTDVGPGSLKQVLENATVISVEAIIFYSLEEMFKEIMRNKHPNQYGMT